jgi:hypothetical protein
MDLDLQSKNDADTTVKQSTPLDQYHKAYVPSWYFESDFVNLKHEPSDFDPTEPIY